MTQNTTFFGSRHSTAYGIQALLKIQLHVEKDYNIIFILSPKTQGLIGKWVRNSLLYKGVGVYKGLVDHCTTSEI